MQGCSKSMFFVETYKKVVSLNRLRFVPLHTVYITTHDLDLLIISTDDRIRTCGLLINYILENRTSVKDP